MLYFAAVITLLVEEFSRYYQQYLDFLENGPSLVPDITESEMFLFLVVVIQMGHDIHDNLKDYWSTTEQFLSPFYGKIVRHDKFIYIHRFLCFSNDDGTFDSNNPNYDRAVAEVMVLFKGQGNFQTIHTQEINILEYKFINYVTSLATHDMGICLGKGSTCVTRDMTATHTTVKQLTKWKDMDISYIWRTFHHPTYSMI
jgi:hypothetical protein